MDKNELLTRIAAILTTLDETKGSPESMLYIFMGMDMDKWSQVRNILIDADLVQIKSHYVTLTPKGKETAQKLNKAIGH